MKLRNKKTGEIVERVDLTIREEGVVFNNDETYNSLAELNNEWEDYEEPEEWWYVDRDGVVDSERRLEESGYNAKQIGNYFESEEEAKRAVEKLQAWRRLKDKGFKFDRWMEDDDSDFGLIILASYSRANIKEDLDLLFGGEE